MKVNAEKFAWSNYESAPEDLKMNPYNIGDVVIYLTDSIQIGVVLQVFSDCVRTDSDGIRFLNEIYIASEQEINLYRPEIFEINNKEFSFYKGYRIAGKESIIFKTLDIESCKNEFSKLQKLTIKRY